MLLADGRTVIVRCADDRLHWFDGVSRREFAVSLCARCDWWQSSPDGSAVLVGSGLDSGRLYRLQELPALAGPVTDPVVDFRGVAYSPDRKIVYAGTKSMPQGGHGFLANAATGQPIGRPMREATYYPAFSSDGKFLAASTPDPSPERTVQVWDAKSGEPCAPPLPMAKFVHQLAFAPDGHTLAIGRLGGTLLWDIRNTGPHLWLPQSAPVGQLLFTPDGSLLATGGKNGWRGAQSTFSVWNVATGQPVGTPVETVDAPIFCFTTAEEAPTPILMTLELPTGRLRRWGAAASKLLSDVVLHPETGIVEAIFRADGRRLLTGYNNGQAIQWDPETGQQFGPVMANSAAVAALAYSPDGQTVAVGCADGTARLWDASTGKAVSLPLVHPCAIRGLTFAADGLSLLVTPADGMTRTWPVAKPSSVHDLASADARLRTASGMRPDGLAIAPISLEDWRAARAVVTACEESASRSDQPFPTLSYPSRAVWHDRRAAKAESEGGTGAMWDLERLIAPERVDHSVTVSTTYFRRADVHASAGRLADADADYRTGGRDHFESLVTWYRRRAAEAHLREQWDLAIWYFDRLVDARPFDWQLRAARSIVETRLGRTAAAHADEYLAALSGADREFLIPHGDRHAAAGQWLRADACYYLAAQRGPFDFQVGQRLAVRCLQQGNREGYRDVVRRALRFHVTENPGRDSILDMAWICSLSPDALSDWQVPLESMEESIRILSKPDKDPAMANARAHFRQVYQKAQAALLFRAGKYREALELLLPLIRNETDIANVEEWLLAALLHQRLGNVKEARRWLDQCKPWLAAPPADADWMKRSRMTLLFAEAAAALDGTKVSGMPKPAAPLEGA